MVRFGVAGYPPAFNKTPYRRNRIKILNWLNEIGLNALELQMTYGPRTRPQVCREYRKLAEDFDIRLSVHAAYYIVFTSKDPIKIQNSSETLKRTFELCSFLGSDILVLHPGPLYGGKSQEAMERFLENLSKFMDEIGSTEIGLFVETAGKVGQLGSIDEVMYITKVMKGVHPCVDFGHVHARTMGTLYDEGAISAIFEKLKDYGHFHPNGHRVHFHYTPIDFGPRGEVSHKAINDKYPIDPQLSLAIFTKVGQPKIGPYHPRFEPIAKFLRKFSVNCTVISETHDSQEEGALALKQAYMDS